VVAVAAPLVLLACLESGCGSSGGSLHGSGNPIDWAPGQAEAADGTPPSYTAAGVCGSDTATYLSELTNGGNPLNAHVLYEWSDIVPGGKQILVSGGVATTHLGPTDNPITHPFGDDLSMDVKLDPQYLQFAKQLGTPDEPSNHMHVELSSGLIPHVTRSSQASPDQTWLQLTNFNLAGIQTGFDKPALGDRALVMGRWIIDCGHPNYGTELHPMSFLGWAHAQGSTTTVHAYYNPYWDTEQYSTDPTVAGMVNDSARFASAQPFPPYFVGEVLRAINGTVDHLSSNELVGAQHTSPVSWQVCAPAGASGSRMLVHYDVETRPGVQVTVAPEASSTCAQVSVTLGPDFVAANTAIRQCVLPWDYLSAIAKQTYGSSVDVHALVDKFVTAPGARAIVDKDPSVSCADAHSGPTVSPSPTGQRIRVDTAQPFPFYGVVTVSLQ
jgi:hypothetical protein